MGSSEKTTTSKLFDTAILITGCTGVMYVLGWAYWDSYFYYFGIDKKFIDLSFHQIIATTWLIAIILLFYSLSVLVEYMDFESKQIAISFWFLLVVISILAVVFYFFRSFFTPMGFYFSILIISGLFGFAIAIYKKKKVKISFNNLRQLSGLLFVLFLLLWISYSVAGYYNAWSLAKGRGNRIQFQLSEKNDLPKELYFITYSENKYFVCTKREGDRKPRVFAIENSKVLKAEIIK